MSLYRVKQFVWALKSLSEDIDTEYVNKFLNKKERKLFNKLKKTDKHHCIRVSKDAVSLSEGKNITGLKSVKVIDKAIIPENPIKPNKMMNIAIAIVLGVMASVFVIFLIEALNTKIKEPKDIEEKLGIPVYGVVPKY